MATRRWFLLGGLIFCGWLAMHMASPSQAQQGATDTSATPSGTKEEKELNVRYAQAYLKSTEATLAELEERNRRNANTIRPAAIQLAQEFVAKARQRLESAQNDEANDSRIHVLRAEANLRSTEEALKKSEAVNRRLPNTISPGDIARLNAEVELAKIKLEKARHLKTESPLSTLRFEMDQLREDVQALQLQEAMKRRGS